MVVLNSKSWIFLSILYLALPVMIWLCGWVQPSFSLPLLAVLTTGIFLVYRKLPSEQASLPRLPFIASLAIIFCATAIIGFTGHFEQNSDFFLRNPIYSNLVRYDWPLVFPDGNLLVYYFGFWLPPALASKFFPLGWSPYLLWLWSLTGMVLFTGTMSFYFKSRIWIFILVLFSLAPLNVVINKTGIVYFLLGVKEVGQDLHWNCCMAQLVCTFNHFIPCLVFGGVFINRMLDKGSLLFFSSLLLLCSPFGGIAFLPYLAAAIYPGKSFFSDMFRSWNARSFFLTASACGIVLVTALFMSGAGSMNVLLLFQKETDESMILLGRTIIFLAANLVIPAILLYPVFRKSSMFWITICGFAACTLIYVGVRYNELVFKTSGVFFFFLAILCTQAFPMLGKVRKFLLVAYIALCSIFPIRLFMHHAKTFSVTPVGIQKNIRNE